jgi:hypothetical protein
MCPSSRPLRAGGRRALGGVLEQDDVQMGAAAGHVGCAEKRLHAGEVAVPQVEAGRGGVGRWAVVGGVHAKRPEVGDGDKSTRAPLQHGSSSVDTSASCAEAVAEAVHGTAATRRPMYWAGAKTLCAQLLWEADQSKFGQPETYASEIPIRDSRKRVNWE